MTDTSKLPPLPPGASLSPSELPALPKGASFKKAPEPAREEDVYVDPATGVQIFGPSIYGQTEPSSGVGKAIEQGMSGVVSMPLRFMLSAAKPVLGTAQTISKVFEEGPQQTFEGLITGSKPTRPLSTIDQAVQAVNQIEGGTNQAAGPLSWLTTRPASLAGDIVGPGGAGKKLYDVGTKYLPNLPRVVNALTGLVGGATTASMQPTDPGLYGEEFAGEKAKQAGWGALTGGTLGYALGAPVSKEVERLRNAGVNNLTPGMMSPTMKGVESFTERYLPFVSGKVSQAEANALESFNYSAARTVLDPLKIEIPTNLKPGYELNSFVKKTIDEKYRNIADKIDLPFDVARKDLITNKIDELANGMSKKSARIFRSEVDATLKNAISGNTIPGKNFREMESSLGTKAMDYVSSKDAIDRTAGSGIFKFQDFMRQQLKDSNPAVANELTAIHSAFKNSLPFQKATKYADAVNGVINPGMLRRASKNLEGTDVPVRDFADAAVNVMGKRVIQPRGSASSRALGVGAEALSLLGSQVPATKPYMVPGMEYVIPGTIAGMRALYSKPGIAAANLISRTPGGALGTAAGAPAGALATFSEDVKRRKAALGLPTE